MRKRVIFAAALLFSAGLPAQTPSPVPAVNLDLRCTAPCSFRQGEPIWLDLDFTAATPNDFQISTVSTDRHRSVEEFYVTPEEGASDPIAPYASWLRGGGIPGNSRPKRLSATPVTLRMDLAQWIRFDKPGEYHVSVVSPRVSGMRLTSNQVLVKISAASVMWQAQQMIRIRAMLAATGPLHRGDAPDAVRELCDLGTEEAAVEMARHMGDDASSFWLYEYGLVRSPFKAAGLRELERLLTAPGAPVTQYFLAGLANLSINLAGDPVERVRRSTAELAALRQKLLAALDVKRGPALAVSADTLLSSNDLSAEDRARVAAALAGKFADLPPEQQVHYLSDASDSFTRQQRVSIYRAAFESNADEDGGLAGAALARWYQLDQAGARAAIVAEMLRPKPRLLSRFLVNLPEPALPEVETALARNFVAATDVDNKVNLAELLQRYATAAALPIVLPHLEATMGRMNCNAQNAAIGFVFKVDQTAGRDLIQRALPLAKNDRCGFLSRIGMEANAYLEQLALGRLTAASPDDVADAAWYLGRHGSVAAEAYLRNRYEIWLQGESSDSANAEANLGRTLVEALAQGQGWFYDAAKLQVMADASPAGIIRQMWQQAAAASGRPLAITVELNQTLTYGVAQYGRMTLEELKQKLAQFPSGSSFRWRSAQPDDPEPIPRDLSGWAASTGISITR